MTAELWLLSLIALGLAIGGSIAIGLAVDHHLPTTRTTRKGDS